MLMKRLAAVFFVLLTLPGLALAQIPFTKVSPTVTLSVSSVSSSVAIGTSARISNLWICNTGAADAYLQMGDSTIVADTTGTLMRSGRCGNVSPDGKLFIASVTASSTTTLSITPGSGIMFTDGGGGGGSGSGTPAGTNGQVQFNNSGAFGGETPAISTGCGASGGTIGNSLIGTIQNILASIAHVTTDTINGSECGKLGTFNSGSAVAITLPAAGTGLFTAGWYEDYTNYGAGVVTFTTSGGTFLTSGTPSTFTLSQGQGVRFTSSTVTAGSWDVSGTGVGGAGNVVGPGSAADGHFAIYSGATGKLLKDTLGTPAASATTDTTNAANISSGSLPLARIAGDVGPVANYITNNWYQPSTGLLATAGNAVIASTTMYCTFGSIQAPSVTIKSLGMRVTAGVAATTVEVAIYSLGSSGIATTMTLVDYGATSTASTGATTVNVSVNNTTDVLVAGNLYAFCAASNGAITWTSYGATGTNTAALIGSSTELSVLSASAVVNGRSFPVTYNSATPASTFTTPITLSTGTETTTVVVPQIVFLVN